jgi:hypothetical protein
MKLQLIPLLCRLHATNKLSAMWPSIFSVIQSTSTTPAEGTPWYCLQSRLTELLSKAMYHSTQYSYYIKSQDSSLHKSVALPISRSDTTT